MIGLLGLVVFVLDIIAIVDCLKSNADTVKKLLWILVILLLPVLGMILSSCSGAGNRRRNPLPLPSNADGLFTDSGPPIDFCRRFQLIP
jgi:hypothetical protein